MRPGNRASDAWHRRYFPRGIYYYPFYSPVYSATVVISPYGYYFGICVPFILRDHCWHTPPLVVYVDVPIYVDGNCRGYAPIRAQDNYLDRSYLWDREPGLSAAVDEIREAFGHGNIDALVALVDPGTRVAVFREGKYDYSLDSSDFVDLTRDALQSMETITFDITRIHERSAAVYVVSGEHAYRDADGRSRKVYVSYVLEAIRGEWTLTQVGTAPDRIQEW